MAVTNFRNLTILNGRTYNTFLAGYPALMAAPTATDGGTGTTASIAFTAQTGATSYTAISSPGSFTGTGTSSPITVSGLTTGTAYTFQIRANNSTGSGPYSAASNSVTPLAPTAFDSIASVNSSGADTSLVFSNIPQTYQHLQLRGFLRSKTASTGNVTNAVIYINGDTGLNYAYHTATGNASTFFASSGSPNDYALTSGAPRSSSTGNTYGSYILTIFDYTQAKNKTLLGHGGTQVDNFGDVKVFSNSWINTAAITSLTIDVSGDFAADSNFRLYGIKGNA